MAYFNTCPNCGANLDPGEPCDCVENKQREEEEIRKSLSVDKKTNQITFSFADKGAFHEEAVI